MSDQSPPKGQRSGTNFDRIAAIFAVLLSLAALFVSFVEVSSERAQQRAEVWPYIQIDPSYSSSGFRLRMVNKGVGPALMGQLVLLHNGQPVQDVDQLIVDTIGAERAFSYDRYAMSDPSNSVVAPGDSLTLFGVSWDDDTRALVQAWNGAIDIDICYCSIHEDCWQASLLGSTQRVERCETGVAL
ncbi:MAG: hypothetical protein AAF290_08760 [Pseudomonadota bacterium]